MNANRRDQFALPLSLDGSTRAYCLHLSFITFNMRSTSSEMPACVSIHYCCAGMVSLLIGMKNICWVQRQEELFVRKEEPEIQTLCSGSEKKLNY